MGEPQNWRERFRQACLYSGQVKIEHPELLSSMKKSVCSGRCWNEDRVPPIDMEATVTDV